MSDSNPRGSSVPGHDKVGKLIMIHSKACVSLISMCRWYSQVCERSVMRRRNCSWSLKWMIVSGLIGRYSVIWMDCGMASVPIVWRVFAETTDVM